MDGYNGKILFIDLTSGSMKEETLEAEVYRSFLGGRGLGVRILYERMKGGVDPLGPDNLLGFVTGPLVGTSVPGASRWTLVAKSPLTSTWGDANCGGNFAEELKSAGYAAVFLSGISPRPVYLLVHDGEAKLRDATDLWGKDTVETRDILQREASDKAVQIACIGPSGESQSLLAAVIHAEGAAARSGLGAVMGAKRLKAVAVRGTQKAPVADAHRVDTLRKEFLKDLKENKTPAVDLLKRYGTSGFLSALVSAGESPIRNWSWFGEEMMPTHGKLDGSNLIKYQVRRSTCSHCPIGCRSEVEIKSGPWAATKTPKPEYETLAAFGNMCLNDNVESVIKANDICNRYGIDTMSAGSVIAFAMECYERGIISKQEIGGIELSWGNVSAIIAILNKIVRREGFGAVLADGVMRAAKQIGRGSEKWAIHVHGQEIGYHDPRVSPGWGACYICDPTPARHTLAHEVVFTERGQEISPYPELLFPDVEFLDYKAKGPLYATLRAYHELLTCSGVCIFMIFQPSYPLVDYISAVTGWDFTIAEGLKAGRRIQTLRQAFNVREGLPLKNFSLPERVASPPAMGPSAGRVVNFEALREGYYRAMDWDVSTGKPSERVLEELGLKELVGKF